MQIWKWHGANNSYTTLVPVSDTELLSGLFTADGTAKAWTTPPRVGAAIERNPKKQLPLGNISFLMGGSVVLDGKAHEALSDLLSPFGQFLELELVDTTGSAHASHKLYFYNPTCLISCIDVTQSEMEGSKVIRPVFLASAVPEDAAIFKDPLRRKVDIYLNTAAHAALAGRIAEAELEGSTLRQIA